MFVTTIVNNFYTEPTTRDYKKPKTIYLPVQFATVIFALDDGYVLGSNYEESGF